MMRILKIVLITRKEIALILYNNNIVIKELLYTGIENRFKGGFIMFVCFEHCIWLFTGIHHI